MLEMQAAIGRVQHRRMNGWTAAPTANADRLRSALAAFSGADGIVNVPVLNKADQLAGSVHAEYKCYAYVRPERLANG